MSSSDIMREIEAKENEREKFCMRSSQVSAIKEKVYKISNEFLLDITNSLSSAKTEITDGIKGINIECFTSDLWELNEASCEEDVYIASVISNLGSEISGCEEKISELDVEISQLYVDYEEALAEEAAEEEAEEEARRAAAAQAADG